MEEIRERLGKLGTFNNRMVDIVSQLDELKDVNSRMINAMTQATLLLGQLIQTRVDPNDILQLLNQSSIQVNDNVEGIINKIQGAPTMVDMNTVLQNLQRAIDDSRPPDVGVPLPAQAPVIGGYSYKPYTSYNSKRPGSYKVSKKKGKKKYSKRKKRMTK